MDKARYQELLFLTLRKEIEDSLDRAFKIMVGGATLIPAVVGIVAYYSATPILLTLPMVVVVTALLYLFQWNSIMRCGRYIRLKLEKDIMGDDGWEAWLESNYDPKIGSIHNRMVDTYLVVAFYLLTAGYYFATCFIALTYTWDAYQPIITWVALAVYILIGVGLGLILFRRVPTNTTTYQERAARPLPHIAIDGFDLTEPVRGPDTAERHDERNAHGLGGGSTRG
jgi:hypothetical protein